MGGGDGGETKQCTLDVLNTRRVQLLGMLLEEEMHFPV